MRESTFVISSICFGIYSKSSYNLSELTTGIQSACPQMEREKAAELREPLMTKTFTLKEHKRLSIWYHDASHLRSAQHDRSVLSNLPEDMRASGGARQ